MHITQLSLTQFRNYAERSIEPCAGINCFWGKNGTGKSNILDAIHFLALTRSFRNTQDALAIQDGAQFFLVQGQFIRDAATYSVQCNCVKGRGKRLIFNGKGTRPSEYYGMMPLVAVLPSDTELINGAAAERRKWMDMLVAQYDRAYLQHLMQYEKVVEQRNALLKYFAEQNTFDAEQLELWNMQLVPHGMALLERRRAFLAEFQPMFEQYFRAIVSHTETPEIAYQATVADNTAEAWHALLAKSADKDRVLQRTNIGVHRDDALFSINGISAKHFGSQGQQKTFVIALKLAEYDLLHAHTGVSPILLLDDIFDKLDDSRVEGIATLLHERAAGQVFITDTSYERLQRVFAPENTQREVRFWEVG